ncbi:MAG: hypothetical protein NC306_08320 [Butyrivibrio sp.]|nr:hypothetical protein [Butyrivibrio sp.]
MTIQLNKNTRRPIALLDWFRGCRALIDTGALIPIWTAKDTDLIELGATLERENISFGGFGGEAAGNQYRINFKLGSIIYADMPIIAKEMSGLSCHMILPATMFTGMVYTINDKEKTFGIRILDNQPVRNLRLSTDAGDLSVYLAGAYESIEEYNIHKLQTQQEH